MPWSERLRAEGTSTAKCGCISQGSQMDPKPPTRKGLDFCSLRYGLALIMHFSNFTMITQRVSLSIAIIAMVNSTEQQSLLNASTEGPLAHTLNHPSSSIKEFNRGASVYKWSPETQGIIFSSISYGIILTLIPSGYLAGIFGAKQMLGAGLLISSLLTLFTPLAADFGVTLVIVVRTVQGMAQGMAWTGQFTIWAKWAPPLERSKLTSIAGSGAAFGSFIILSVGGLICQALGWPFIFYIFGSIGCICCLLWFTVIYDDPVHHPCISVREKEHIVSSLAQQFSSTICPHKSYGEMPTTLGHFHGFFQPFLVVHHNHNIPPDVHQFCAPCQHQREWGSVLPAFHCCFKLYDSRRSVGRFPSVQESTQINHCAKTLFIPRAAPPIAVRRGPALCDFKLHYNHYFADTYSWDQQPV
ncbi:sodium-dependent phosphate transport protein 3 isoform X2 [Dasypus novemcinctus]|uniref:sodium-dependent phosphate transport protein 3 isoform X2 n=1 Tax=Dasypus novemcinctus TaxID=9361 RepID=UPI0003290A68|nr:sodium-dependent phosphate transport protein 3 isoform X2 [Dasypus novemcinctus]